MNETMERKTDSGIILVGGGAAALAEPPVDVPEEDAAAEAVRGKAGQLRAEIEKPPMSRAARRAAARAKGREERKVAWSKRAEPVAEKPKTKAARALTRDEFETVATVLSVLPPEQFEPMMRIVFAERYGDEGVKLGNMLFRRKPSAAASLLVAGAGAPIWTPD